LAYFNEIFEADGKVRPHYEGIYDHWSSLPRKKRRTLHVRSKTLFSGDYFQDPLPRILTAGEFAFLSRGVEQRARAIRAFLTDYMAKGRAWNSIMPAHLLHSTISRHHAENVLRKMRPDRLALPYGPDIIRDRDGLWRVIEDSAGVLGGLGDLLSSRRILYRLVPKFRSILGGLGDRSETTNDPLQFFGHLAHHFRQKAAEYGGLPLLYLHPFQKEPDGETRRLAEALSKFGIEWTTSSNHLRRLEIKEGKNGGVFLKTRGGSRERVGALLFRSNPEQFDRTWLLAEFVKLINPKTGIPLHHLVRYVNSGRAQTSLIRELLAGSVWTNFSPCTQFVNDKVFGLFVDKMVRRLLNEEPLLKSIPAEPVAKWSRKSGWRCDRGLLERLARDKDRYVVKRVDDDGGSGVWIGMKESRESLLDLLESLRGEPQQYLVQEFEHLSVLDGRIVDLRIHAHVDHERIIVSNTPWGRANWIHGDGKVNIGSQGFVSPVVVLNPSGKPQGYPIISMAQPPVPHLDI